MTDRTTIETYNRFASTYDKGVVDFWEEFPRGFIQQFANNLPGKKQVLDLGSGSGRDALLLQEYGLDVTCMDASTSMVDITTSLGFESHLATFADMPFAPQTFDGIWAYTSLIHVPKDEARETIEKVHTLLKPHGLFVIGAIAGQTAGMVERHMQGAERYFKYYEPDELKRLITPLGFRLLHEQDYQPHTSVYLNQLYLAE